MEASAGDTRAAVAALWPQRSRQCFERATKLKALAVQLDLHIVPDCKHLVPWDAEKDVARLAIPFLKA